jgi:hypothetical protein
VQQAPLLSPEICISTHPDGYPDSTGLLCLAIFCVKTTQKSSCKLLVASRAALKLLASLFLYNPTLTAEYFDTSGRNFVHLKVHTGISEHW